jgi:hypothetical protein
MTKSSPGADVSEHILEEFQLGGGNDTVFNNIVDPV